MADAAREAVLAGQALFEVRRPGVVMAPLQDELKCNGTFNPAAVRGPEAKETAYQEVWDLIDRTKEQGSLPTYMVLCLTDIAEGKDAKATAKEQRSRRRCC